MPDTEQATSTQAAHSADAGTKPDSLTDAAPDNISLRRIRYVLSDSRDTNERREAAQQLLPLLWDRLPWRRYAAGCALTTRVYLPSGLFVLEWQSFPNVLTRELRRNRYVTLPVTSEEQRDALAHTLGAMLAHWYGRYTPRSQTDKPRINMDVAADVCEAIGRLGIVEAEADLLDIARHFQSDTHQVRSAALLALAALPPEGLTRTWQWLNTGSASEKRLVAAALAYMTLPGAVPFLLDALPGVVADPDLHTSLGIPLLLALGRIGDVAALSDLNALARTADHPLQPTARKAIQRIMKEAEGHEEVTLVRASGAYALGEDALLRPSSGTDTSIRPELLLRAAPTAARPPARSAGEQDNSPHGSEERK